MFPLAYRKEMKRKRNKEQREKNTQNASVYKSEAK